MENEISDNQLSPNKLLGPVTFRVFDKKLRKQIEKLSTDDCEFVAGPSVRLPEPPKPPAPKKKSPRKRRRR